ncbi:MliC family protein [Xanthomonas sp. 1678]|uniref:MliC family protein n=1 Tax=Xanthomonas sp. 1678 TaxID=3158788 RepID=UPI0028621764|nr:membrane-bound inhibitor of C-type lysozyme [Xanthomonas translucens]
MRPILVFSLLLPLSLAACGRAPAPATTAAPAATQPAGAATGAPATDPEVQADALRVHWQCGDSAVQADVDAARERVALLVNGRTLHMHRVDADSGARYADAQGNAFWEQPQDAATLTLSGQREVLKCVRQGSGVIG